MKNQGKVTALFVSVKGQSRITKEYLELDEKGVVGDKFYGKNLTRSVLVASLDSYTIAKENGIDAPYSALGENILVSINTYSLNPGDKLYIGEVIFQITQNCSLCQSLGKVDERLPEILQDDRGIFVKTIKSGVIRLGDSVTY